MEMLRAHGSWEAGLRGDYFPCSSPRLLSLTTLLIFLNFYKLYMHTDLELVIKNPSSPLEQRTYIFTGLTKLLEE